MEQIPIDAEGLGEVGDSPPPRTKKKTSDEESGQANENKLNTDLDAVSEEISASQNA